MFLVLLTQIYCHRSYSSSDICNTKRDTPLARGYGICSRHYFLTLSDHGAKDRQSFESAIDDFENEMKKGDWRFEIMGEEGDILLYCRALIDLDILLLMMLSNASKGNCRVPR